MPLYLIWNLNLQKKDTKPDQFFKCLHFCLSLTHKISKNWRLIFCLRIKIDFIRCALLHMKHQIWNSDPWQTLTVKKREWPFPPETSYLYSQFLFSILDRLELRKRLGTWEPSKKNSRLNGNWWSLWAR